MHKIIPYILAACCLCMVASCNTVFDVHPYDVQIDGDRNLNVTNIQKIEAAVKSKDTIRFAMISDSHQPFSKAILPNTNTNADTQGRQSLTKNVFQSLFLHAFTVSPSQNPKAAILIMPNAWNRIQLPNTSKAIPPNN